MQPVSPIVTCSEKHNNISHLSHSQLYPHHHHSTSASPPVLPHPRPPHLAPYRSYLYSRPGPASTLGGRHASGEDGGQGPDMRAHLQRRVCVCARARKKRRRRRRLPQPLPLPLPPLPNVGKSRRSALPGCGSGAAVSPASPGTRR